MHRRKAYRVSLILFLLGAHGLAPGTLGAQEQPPDLFPAAIEQQDLIVWDHRPASPAGTASVTVSSRDADEMVARDIGALLQSTVPGVGAVRLGAAHADPVVRGTRAERVSVNVDGARVHGACPSRMDPETALLDVADVEAIEVVKGPYAVTRGPAGVGGTINIRTKEPVLTPSLMAHGSTLGAYTSNADGWTGRASAAVTGPQAAAQVSGTWRDFGDYSAGNGETIPSRFEDRSAGGVFLWQPTPTDRIRLNANASWLRDARFASSTMDTPEQDAYLGAASYTRQAPIAGIEVVTISGYANHIRHLMDNAHKPTANMMKMWAPLYSDTQGGRIQASTAPLGPFTVTAGGDVYRIANSGRRHMVSLTGPMAGMDMSSDVWPDSHIMDGGLFGEAIYTLSSHWRLVVGARLDFVDAAASPDAAARTAFARYNGPGGDHTDVFEVNSSANARLIYSPVETMDLFLGIGRSVRTASPVERFFVLGPGRGGYLVGNPTLDPEESVEVDVGAAGQWGRVRLNGSVFYNRIDAYIVPVLLARTDVNMDGVVDLVRGYRNQDAMLAGTDWGVSLTVSPTLEVFGSLAYVYGQDEQTHQPLPEIPSLEGSIGFGWQRGWEVTGVEGLWTWCMPRVRMVNSQNRVGHDFGENTSPGYFTVDVLGGVRAFGRYELSLNVSNLLDRTYHEHLTRENPFTGAEVPEPGRMVNMALRVTL